MSNIQFEPLFQFIEANLHRKISLAEAAAVAMFSPVHLSRLFQFAYGMTPAEYVRRRKLTESVAALQDKSKTVLEIALDFGFEHEQSFTRAFRAEFGVTPGRYRAAGMELPILLPIQNYGTACSGGRLFGPEAVFLPEIRLLGTWHNIPYKDSVRLAPEAAFEFWDNTRPLLPNGRAAGIYYGLTQHFHDDSVVRGQYGTVILLCGNGKNRRGAKHKMKEAENTVKDEYIRIKNARIHNLKGIDVSIPKHRITVITGVSGSGKSSLAFDTLYEEGKRRYLMFSETQFMIDAVPCFDAITGLSPTVAVEQRIIRQSNPRSTVGTRVKVSHLLAALFANYGDRDPAYDDGLPLDVSMFQRGSAKGMCVKCLGKGTTHFIDEAALFADQDQLICDIACGLGRRSSTRQMLSEFGERYGFDPWNGRVGDLSPEQLMLLKYGDHGQSKFPGMIPWITMLVNGALSTSGRLANILTAEGMMDRRTCPKCLWHGAGRAGGAYYLPRENHYRA